MNKNDSWLYWLGYLLIIVIVFFLFSAILMWLWNAVIVVVFGLPVISYWQSCGLFMISDILFSSGNIAKTGGKND